MTVAIASVDSASRNRSSAIWLRSQLIHLAADLARVSAYELTPPSAEDLRRRLIAIVEGRAL